MVPGRQTEGEGQVDVARDLLVISQKEVRKLLPMAECIEVVADALRQLSADKTWMPLRSILDLPVEQGAVFGFMPSALLDRRVFGVKVTSVFPSNEGSPFQSHQGAVLVFEGAHGRLLAVVDGSEITAIRTGAASGVATRLLAREDAGDLALLGSGVQAAMHLQAMAEVRNLRSVRVWSVPLEDARRFQESYSDRFGVPVRVTATAEEAVKGADLICTTTPATTPILRGAMISPGAHINAVGFSGPTGRELDAEAVARARVFVDRRESTLNEAGEFLLGMQEGAFGPDHILAELGELLLGQAEGRRSSDEITLFRSLGVGVEDLAAASYVYEQARREGSGTAAFLGGLR